MRAQLLVVPDCPHEGPAMSLLLGSLREAGLGDVPVDVVVLHDDRAADERRFSGSPSFCIDDVDLFPADPSGLACRVYPAPGGRGQGLPEREQLVRRLLRVAQGR